MARVLADDLRTYFGDVRAVDGVNVEVQNGEFMVLLGPSGCGKTTLMRTIAGLEAPTEGEIWVDDEIVNMLPPRARNVAMVFQSYALYPHKTIEANIAFPLKAIKMDKAEIRERVEWASQMLGIEPFLKRKPGELSGGEQQRVALARAIVRQPNVFLLDEPLSNLDAKLRHQARDELKNFHEKIGTTTIYVTHDQVEAMGLGERIAIMNNGRVHQLGTPTDVYRNPADTFVATFVGSPPMNLIEQEDGPIVGFRPEHFMPKETFDAGDDLKPFQFYVWRVEYLGADRLLYGSLSKGDTSMKTIARLPATLTFSVDEGQNYEFAVRTQDVRYFDPDTGQAQNNGSAQGVANPQEAGHG